VLVDRCWLIGVGCVHDSGNLPLRVTHKLPTECHALDKTQEVSFGIGRDGTQPKKRKV